MPRKGRSGRKPLGTRAMTKAEVQERYRMKKKAAKMEVKRVEDMDNYNVFGPEREAREFINALVSSNGNLISAMRSMFPPLKNRDIEYVYERGMKMIAGSRIKELMVEELNKEGATVSKIVSDLYKISQDETTAIKDKLRALELLGKFRKIFDMEDKKGDTYNLNISEDAAKRLLTRRDERNVIDVKEEPDRL